jgi:hypothetical protein
MNNPSSNGAGIEILFVCLALLGLAGTWAQGFGYLELGLVAGNVQFWKDAFGGPASTFLAVDILVLAAALFVWMFAEARRLEIGAAWIWAYYLASMFIGISFAVPLFLAHRHRRVRLHRPTEHGSPAGSDWVAVGVAIVIAIVAAGYSLSWIR